MKLSWFSALSFALVLGLVACKNDKSAETKTEDSTSVTTVALDQTVDLSKEFGQTIRVKAPQGFKSTFTDGIMPEAVVEGTNYYVQILAQDLFDQNIAGLKNEALNEVKAMSEFSSIVKDEANGFVYETTWGDKKAYNFRYFHVAGAYAYDFRTSTAHDFTKEQVMAMYEAVKH